MATQWHIIGCASLSSPSVLLGAIIGSIKRRVPVQTLSLTRRSPCSDLSRHNRCPEAVSLRETPRHLCCLASYISTLHCATTTAAYNTSTQWYELAQPRWNGSLSLSVVWTGLHRDPERPCTPCAATIQLAHDVRPPPPPPPPPPDNCAHDLQRQ